MRKIAVLLSLCLVGGCDVQDQAMRKQKKYVTYAPSNQWEDGAAARPLPAHTTPVETQPQDQPPEATLSLIERGRQRYEIYCTPCHGNDGSGRGMVVMRGFPQPPSYHSDRLRKASAQHFFEVITNGYGVMYPYRDRVSVRDRWAIISYIRALQATRIAAAGQSEAPQ